MDINGVEAQLRVVRNPNDLPTGLDLGQVACFFHETMKPFHDELHDVQAALDYAFVEGKGQGGYLALAHHGSTILGCVCMLNTGMGGYVPANILLFVSIAPETRGQGLGEHLIRFALDHCKGDVKLHVEYDNPAKRLYERMGFVSKYAEMRLVREKP